MTDRGIIFSPPMVRALIDDRKTQTRRLATSPLRRCEVGDRLYVRETWSGLFWDVADIDGSPRELWATPRIERTKQFSSGVFYKLDEDAKPGDLRFVPEGQWSPSIHMPRWASRLTLIVEAVRVEPLQSISKNDCYAEGIDRPTGPFLGSEVCARDNARNDYRSLWQSLHVEEGGRWEDNPDVVALTFRVERKNIDA